MRGNKRLPSILLAAALAVANAPARADNAADKAAAEALFNHAKQLTKEGKFSEACPKFAESQRLDPGVGTMLYLADCYEKSGKTASAWAQFLEAAAAAKASGQADRETKARQRAAALEPNLCRVTMQVPIEAQTQGVEIKRDGTVVAKPLWDTTVPVDPGDHKFEASATGYKPWQTYVAVKAGECAAVNVKVPALEKEAPKVEPPKPEPPKVEPPKPEPPKPEPPKPPSQDPVPPRRSGVDPNPGTPSGPRTFGFIATGLGVAGVAVGGIVGVVAMTKNNDSKLTCKTSGWCWPEGEDQRALAATLGNVATGALSAGGALFLTGVILLIATNDKATSEKMVLEADKVWLKANGTKLRAAPLTALGAGGVVVEGAF